MKSFGILGLILAGLTAGAPATVSAQTAPDQDVLQRQRELLLQRRQETQRTRTLLEISPSTGTTEQAPAGSGESAVLSTEPEPQKVQNAAAAQAQSREEIAKASVPAELPPEHQLFRPINFAYDSAYLDQPAREILDGLCATLQADLGANPGSNYYVIGHTDAAGPEGYNHSLSRRRAESTKQYLVENCGIASAQLNPVGMGEERLLVSADPRAADQRRVEIQVRIPESGG